MKMIQGQLRCWNTVFAFWGAATITLIHAYDSDTVVIGGGAIKASPRILPSLTQYIQKHAWTPWGMVKVRPALLAENASLLGMTTLFDTCEDKSGSIAQPAT